MSKEEQSQNEPMGFKINDRYFIEFPPGDFVHEDEDGKMYVDVNIYENVDGDIKKLSHTDLTEEIQDLVNTSINKILKSAIDEALDHKDTIDNV